MRNRIIAATALLIAIAVFFSGCDALTFNSAENLVRPPKLSGDEGALQSAFESAMTDKGEYILKYPLAGAYRSAFVRYDCDSDGSDEAFVFYSLKAEEMSVNMYMLDFVDGKWTPVGTTPGEGNDVYSIEFSDLNDDGSYEILVGWSSMDSKSNKKLSVYCSYEDSNDMNYRVLAIESYTSMYTVDLDYDGEKEILLALINSTSDTYTTEARLLKMTAEGKSDFQISAVGQISLYSEITAINSIVSGWSVGKKYVYIDEAAGDSYLTEILYWDEVKKSLNTAFTVDMLTVAACPTSRSLPLNCEDIDNDGEIEIPVTKLMQNSEVVSKKTETDLTATSSNVYIISWNKYDGGNFTSVDSYISNEYDGFKLKYDEELMKDWCVTFYPDNGISQFFVLKNSDNSQSDVETELLFTITTVPASESVNIGSYLITGDEFKYTCDITEEGEKAGLTRSAIVSYFSLI